MTLTSTAKVAIAYKRRGWPVVPVPFRQKGPKIDGWSRLRLTEPEILQHFNGEPMNVGILLGEPSGIVDVDLDCPESRKLAADLLPPTDCIFGRNGSPGSHRIYAATINGERTSMIKGPAGDSLVELRATGSQTLFPPSTHTDGDEIGWESTGEPAHVDLPQLVAAVRELSGACLLLRRYPELGSRHDFALGLAGGLLRAGWSVPRVERFVEVISTAAGDDEVEDRVRAVADTKAAIAAGEEATGWPTLAKLIDGAGTKEKFVERVRQLLRIASDKNTDSSLSLGIVSVSECQPLLWKPFPIEVLPSSLRRFVSEAASSLGCDPAFVVLPALAVIASAIGTTRRIRLKPTWAEPPIVWVAVVAKSGTLKSPALEIVLDHLRTLQARAFQEYEERLQVHERDVLNYEVSLKAWKASKLKGTDSQEDPPVKPEEPVADRLYCSDVTIEALAPLLLSNRRGLLLARDELSAWFGSYGAYKGGRGADVAHWLELHRLGTLLVDRKSGVPRTIHVRRAAVSICGTIQPQTLARALGLEHFENGLAARLLLAMPPTRRKRWNDHELAPQVRESFKTTIERLLELEHGTDPEGALVPIDMPLSPEGKDAWVEFYNAFADLQADVGEDDLAAAFSKIEGYAARLALIIHLVRSVDDDPTLANHNQIDKSSILAGATLARWFGHETERIYKILGESDADAFTRPLVEIIQRRGGSVTVRDWQRLRSHKTAEDARAELNLLAESELGHWHVPRQRGRGRPPAGVFKLTDTDTNSDDDAVSGNSVSFSSVRPNSSESVGGEI